MRPTRSLLAALVAALVLTACASTQTTGPDAGPSGPPVPSDPAKIIAGYVGAGLEVAEAGFTFGAGYAADQGQALRCYVLLGFEKLAHVGGEYATSIPLSGEWLSVFPEVTVDPKRCNPTGLPPKVTPQTAATVDKLCQAVVGPLTAITHGVLSTVGVSCRWVSWAEGIEKEILNLPGAILKALAGEPFVLPRVELRVCPSGAAPVGVAPVAEEEAEGVGVLPAGPIEPPAAPSDVPASPADAGP